MIDLIWDILGLSGVLSVLLLIAQLIVNATPTEKDNDILDWIKRNVLDKVLSNRKKGGGVHPPKVPPERIPPGLDDRDHVDDFLNRRL